MKEPTDHISVSSLVWGIALLTALLVWLNAFPQWVGCPVAIGPPDLHWEFLPLLAPGIRPFLLLIDVWLGLALALKVVLLRRRRWQAETRWADLGLDFFGAFALFQLFAGHAAVGLDPEWMSYHGWPRDLWDLEEELLSVIAGVVRPAVLVASIGLIVRASVKLFRLTRARQFVKEGLAGRTVPEVVDLFKKDAGRAYDVFDRDKRFGPEPEGLFRRTWHRMKVLYHGVTAQLTPPRRLLFVACLVAALVHGEGTVLALAGGLALLLMLELVDRVRVRDELQVARQLQRDLMPADSPRLPGYDVAHSYRIANEVGGDYYDFLPADERTALVVCDASGHGIAAGMIMAIANATLKAAVDDDPDPEKVVAQLHRALFRTGDRRAFMTIFYAALTPESGALSYVCAGHPYPLLRRAAGEIVELGTGSLPAGIRESSSWTKESASLEPGDRLVLFSDGLPEAVNGPDGEAFGFRRIRELVAPGGTPQEIHDRILQALDAHMGDEPIADDLTLVVVGRHSK